MNIEYFNENKFFAIFLFLVLFIYFCKCIQDSKERFSVEDNINYRFYRPEYKCPEPKINKKNKSKPVENKVEERIIFTRPNKCFACEAEMLQKYAKQYINLAFPGKCFSCENQAKKEGKNPYNEGPTKCFSCKN